MRSMVEGPDRVPKSKRDMMFFARDLRRTMSLPEVLLWRELRQRSAGLKVRRQHPIGPYVADFFCAAGGLVIEVDGGGHGVADRPERDARRDSYISSRGLKIMRIPAQDVLDDLPTIVGEVGGACPSTAFGGPPPQQAGEDLR